MHGLDVGKQGNQNCRKNFGSVVGIGHSSEHVMQGLRLKTAVDAGPRQDLYRSYGQFRLGDSHKFDEQKTLFVATFTFGKFSQKPGFLGQKPWW